MSAGAQMFDHYRERVSGTTIDSSTLLSTDYFNLFNEVIMLLGMLPDMPDMLDEVSAWEFKTYAQHFETSGLAFAPLAIEAYPHAPASALTSFEQNIEKMRSMIEEAKLVLRAELAGGDMDVFAGRAIRYSMELQRLVDTGSAIVHGQEAVLNQNAIDDLF
jgi:hypothetical protein